MEETTTTTAAAAAGDSDDETIEYSIEIVDSSSSIPSSIADNLSHSSSSASLQEQEQQPQQNQPKQREEQTIPTTVNEQQIGEIKQSEVIRLESDEDEFEVVAHQDDETIVQVETETEEKEMKEDKLGQFEIIARDDQVESKNSSDNKDDGNSIITSTMENEANEPKNLTEVIIEVQLGNLIGDEDCIISLDDSVDEIESHAMEISAEPETELPDDSQQEAKPNDGNQLNPIEPQEVFMNQSCNELDGARVNEIGDSDDLNAKQEQQKLDQTCIVSSIPSPSNVVNLNNNNDNLPGSNIKISSDQLASVEPLESPASSYLNQIENLANTEVANKTCDNEVNIAPEVIDNVKLTPLIRKAEPVQVDLISDQVEKEPIVTEESLPPEQAEIFEDSLETQSVEPIVSKLNVAETNSSEIDTQELNEKVNEEEESVALNVSFPVNELDQLNVCSGTKEEEASTANDYLEANEEEETKDDGSFDDVTLIEDTNTTELMPPGTPKQINSELNDEPLSQLQTNYLAQDDVVAGDDDDDDYVTLGHVSDSNEQQFVDLDGQTKNFGHNDDDEEEKEPPMEPASLLPHITTSHTLFAKPEDGCLEEDLEHEFDVEPALERRHVEIKLDRNPRNEYSMEDELGRGKFGIIYRCTEQASGQNFAAKFVHVRRLEDREDVSREVEIMNVLQHKRLLQLFDAFDDGKSEMCLITELVEGGELFERIVNDDFELTEKKAAIFMRQICEGVEYMHSLNIVHLDMKPENILCISRTGNRIKLIDFGLARRLNPLEPLRVMFGTPDFAAPEVLAYDVVSLATDMWSVGVICYVLLSGLSPFMGDNDIDTMANVTRATYDFEDTAFDPISDLAKDFISKLLVKDQTQRLKPIECLQHAWLQRGGRQLEASVRERRNSMVMMDLLSSIQQHSDIDDINNNIDNNTNEDNANAINNKPMVCCHLPTVPALFLVDQTIPCSPPSLDKRNLKKYVVRRKWHKTVHAIMALQRMGANLKF